MPKPLHTSQKITLFMTLRDVSIAQWQKRHTYLAQHIGLNDITCISVAEIIEDSFFKLVNIGVTKHNTYNYISSV